MNLNFEDFFKLKTNPTASLADEVVVYDREYLVTNRPLDPENTPSLRINAMVFILCRYGKMTARIDNKICHLSKGSLLWLNSFHVINEIKIDNNCTAVALVIAPKIMNAIIRDTPMIKHLLRITNKPPEPVFTIEDDEMRELVNRVTRIKDWLKKTDHAFQSYIVKNETTTFVMEIVHLYMQKLSCGEKSQGPIRESRRDEVFRAFILLLLKHYREHHDVSFYAGKLGMTPGSLTRNIITAGGYSPIQLIGKTLAAEAQTLLRKPGTNIQQIADELHFGSQSSFGKFFKRHTGMTPTEYRNGA